MNGPKVMYSRAHLFTDIILLIDDDNEEAWRKTMRLLLEVIAICNVILYIFDLIMFYIVHFQ